MQKAIIGKKIGMTQIFDEKGNVIPVTLVEAGPCVVTQKRTVEKDGYSAIQLGYEDIAERKLNKPEKGHLAKAGTSLKKYLKEFKLDDAANMNVGDEVTAAAFAEGDAVDVCGKSKGHGYSGTIKRWGQHRQEMTHGVGPIHRSAGSMGANSSPSRVFKNKHLPGQYGNERVTVQNLTIAKVDAENNLIAVKGAIPGAKGGLVFITTSVKA